MIQEAYRWLLAPMQEVRPAKKSRKSNRESFRMSAGAPNIAREIEHVLRDNELSIAEWAPIHLCNILKTCTLVGTLAGTARAAGFLAEACLDAILPAKRPFE